MMMWSKGIKVSSTFVFLLLTLPAFASGGACPANAPVTGNNCYFVAATGADTNTGMSESSPFLHAPGMPNCSANCASAFPSSPNSSAAGMGIIMRGGDTWHFGNSNATPYTGGTWDIIWHGTVTNGATVNCQYEGTQTGCVYIGVDKTWYNSSVCGGSWCRPILNGDNPTSTSIVGSCTYQTTANANNSGLPNNLLIISGNDNAGIYFDGFEMTGLCGQTGYGNPNHGSTYLLATNWGSSNASGDLLYNNIYMHGWTVTSLVNTDSTVCTLLGGDPTLRQSITGLVIDGADSFAQGCVAASFPSFFNFTDSIVRNTMDMVGQNCHNIHDVIFENQPPILTGGHQNVLECNNDYPGGAPNQPSSTVNVIYNTVMRHINSNVDWWVCPTNVPEYWFNNMMYDVAGEGWAIAGPSGYSCSNAGGQFMFNNTFVDSAAHPCHLTGSNNTGGKYLTVYNEHLINTPWDGTGCTGGASSGTNISMSDATATSQGYTTGSAGKYEPNNCANEGTTPCAPMGTTGGTVGSGASHMAYCDTLASYSSEHAIGSKAANACKYGTTDGCAYDLNTHTMVCPAQTAVARPVNSAWDVGTYQYSSQNQPPAPPTALQATVQ